MEMEINCSLLVGRWREVWFEIPRGIIVCLPPHQKLPGINVPSASSDQHSIPLWKSYTRSGPCLETLMFCFFLFFFYHSDYIWQCSWILSLKSHQMWIISPSPPGQRDSRYHVGFTGDNNWKLLPSCEEKMVSDWLGLSHHWDICDEERANTRGLSPLLPDVSMTPVRPGVTAVSL